MLKISAANTNSHSANSNQNCAHNPNFGAWQKTLVILKPDAFEKGLVPEITDEIKKLGCKITAQADTKANIPFLKEHYAEHQGRSYYDEMMAYISRGIIRPMVVEGEDAITRVRAFIKNFRAEHGCKPKDTENFIHASDAIETAEREINNFRKHFSANA